MTSHNMHIALLLLVATASAAPTFKGSLHQNVTANRNVTDPNNLYCTTCTEVVGEVQSQGCDLACSGIPPPGDMICSWMLRASGLCQEIIKWLDQGLTPAAICKDMGFCGSACECGVCTQAGAGPNGRCLGAPNDCGHSGAAPGFLKDQSNSKFCLDGQCGDSGSIGCCLTCF